MFKKVLLIAFASLCLFACSAPVLASGIIPDPADPRLTQTGKCTNADGNITVECVNKTFVTVFWERFERLAGYMAALAVIIVIIAGIQYALARGDVKKITTARTMIFQSMVAVALLVAAFSVVTLLWSIATSINGGVNGTKVNLPTSTPTPAAAPIELR